MKIETWLIFLWTATGCLRRFLHKDPSHRRLNLMISAPFSRETIWQPVLFRIDPTDEPQLSKAIVSGEHQLYITQNQI